MSLSLEYVGDCCGLFVDCEHFLSFAILRFRRKTLDVACLLCWDLDNRELRCCTSDFESSTYSLGELGGLAHGSHAPDGPSVHHHWLKISVHKIYQREGCTAPYQLPSELSWTREERVCGHLRNSGLHPRLSFFVHPPPSFSPSASKPFA